MIDAIVNSVVEYIRQLGGLGVLLGILLETFIAPIPSPLVPMSAGFILIPPDATFYEVLIVCFFTISLFGSFGATAGAFFGYAIGYYGGRPLIKRYGKYFGVSWEDVEKVEKMMGKRSKPIALFLSRALPIVPLSPVSFFAGFIRYDTFKFAIITLAGALPRYFALGVIGWWAGVAYEGLMETIGFIETLVLALIVVGVAGVFIYSKRERLVKFLMKEE